MSARPQNKHLNPKLGQQALGIVPLGQDEVTQIVRIRTDRDAMAWFSGLTAAARGELIAQLHRRATEEG
ncbi:hypothetical protein [Deinococcus sonorensis]|uniref:CopG family transcriptional regulator n=2 Tax=Deinococcus sonorensis TaxID=309891 RepID=A0AAU7U6Q5_9DEIO